MLAAPETECRLVDAMLTQHRRIKEKRREHSLISSEMRWLDQLLRDEESYLRRQLYERGYDPDEI